MHGEETGDYEIDSYAYCIGINLKDCAVSEAIYEDFYTLAGLDFDRIVTFSSDGFKLSQHQRARYSGGWAVYELTKIWECDGCEVENAREVFGSDWLPRKKGE